MKGVLFNLLETAATVRWGEDAWDDVLAGAGLTGAYTAIGSYPDEEFMVLLARLPSAADADERLRWFGRAALPLLAGRYPDLFAGHTGVRSFLLSMNDAVHPRVRTIYPDADVPVLGFDPSAVMPDEPLLVSYQSRRRLCVLAEGMILGTGDHFGEHVELAQQQCMLRGDERCLIACVLHPAEVTVAGR